MENKEFPEMEEQAPLTEASGFPSDTEVAQEPPAAEDFFADILPDQPVSQENAFFMEPDTAEARKPARPRTLPQKHMMKFLFPRNMPMICLKRRKQTFLYLRNRMPLPTRMRNSEIMTRMPGNSRKCSMRPRRKFPSLPMTALSVRAVPAAERRRSSSAYLRSPLPASGWPSFW